MLSQTVIMPTYNMENTSPFMHAVEDFLNIHGLR